MLPQPLSCFGGPFALPELASSECLPIASFLKESADPERAVQIAKLYARVLGRRPFGSENLGGRQALADSGQVTSKGHRLAVSNMSMSAAAILEFLGQRNGRFYDVINSDSGWRRVLRMELRGRTWTTASAL
jgi:hypothetical protein